MDTTTYETESCIVTIDDAESLCPIWRGMCRTNQCAMALYYESDESTIYFCGLVATDENANLDAQLCAPWTKSVYRERKE